VTPAKMHDGCRTMESPSLAAVRKAMASGSSEVLAVLSGLRAIAGALPGPPVSVEDISARIGFRIIPLAGMEDAFSGIVSMRDALIGVNARHSYYRQRFTIAHELGHILLGHPPECRCTAEEVRMFNRRADQCAAEMLMPEEFLMPLLSGDASPLRLARQFEVSESAMKRRLSYLRGIGVLPPSVL